MIGFNSLNLDYIIAGGIDENKSLSKKMYRVFVQDSNENIFQTTKQPIILGKYENLQFCAEELPDMIATRQDSSLTVRPTSQGNYQIYIIGGTSSQKAPFIDVFDSETYEWHSFHPNL